MYTHCSVELVIEALMPSKCQEAISLERLEVLGDAVLKYIASLFLYSHRPTAHEGSLRQHLMSPMRRTVQGLAWQQLSAICQRCCNCSYCFGGHA